jgi:hypothetical protein
LEALRSDTSAFGSSYEEELDLPETEWKKRMNNVLSAMLDDKPVGMVGYAFNTRPNQAHS